MGLNRLTAVVIIALAGVLVAVPLAATFLSTPSGVPTPGEATTGSTVSTAGADPVVSTAPVASPAPLAASPCRGIDRCHQVAATDVDGDARTDRIGWRQVSNRWVAIRVATADRELLARRVNVRWWPGGGAWAGAARVDGAKGRELLVGSTLGAHTPLYTVLTYRDGRLVVERSPRGDDAWYVDAAYNTAFGWWRGKVGNEVRMAEKHAYGKADRTFSGANTAFAWRHGRWVELRSTRQFYERPRAAYKIAGWHVLGLQRFPAV